MKRATGSLRSLEFQLTGLFVATVRWLERNQSPKSAPTGPQRALICKWCCMGDAILTLYAIREWKRRNPDLEIDMLVSARIAEVYRRAPEIRSVHTLPLTGRNLLLELLHPKLWWRLAALLLTLRRRRYAQFVDLELYRGTGPVLKRLLGIPFSRGFRVPGAPPKGHDAETDRPKDIPEWQCFYRVLGMEIPAFPPAPLFSRDALRSGRQPGISGQEIGFPLDPEVSLPVADSRGVSRIGIVYGSSFNWPQKKWPTEYYAAAMTLLAGEGYEFVLFGTAAETEDARLILSQAEGRILDTTGRLDFAGLQREVAACDLVVGNDTGTLHLASACGVPTLTLFGPTDPRKWNGLTSTPMFLEGLACRPCYYLSSMPPCNHYSCLRKLRPELVAERIRSMVNGRKPAVEVPGDRG